MVIFNFQIHFQLSKSLQNSFSTLKFTFDFQNHVHNHFQLSKLLFVGHLPPDPLLVGFTQAPGPGPGIHICIYVYIYIYSIHIYIYICISILMLMEVIRIINFGPGKSTRIVKNRILSFKNAIKAGLHFMASNAIRKAAPPRMAEITPGWTPRMASKSHQAAPPRMVFEQSCTWPRMALNQSLLLQGDGYHFEEYIYIYIYTWLASATPMIQIHAMCTNSKTGARP